MDREQQESTQPTRQSQGGGNGGIIVAIALLTLVFTLASDNQMGLPFPFSFIAGLVVALGFLSAIANWLHDQGGSGKSDNQLADRLEFVEKQLDSLQYVSSAGGDNPVPKGAQSVSGHSKTSHQDVVAQTCWEFLQHLYTGNGVNAKYVHPNGMIAVRVPFSARGDWSNFGDLSHDQQDTANDYILKRPPNDHFPIVLQAGQGYVLNLDMYPDAEAVRNALGLPTTEPA